MKNISKGKQSTKQPFLFGQPAQARRRAPLGGLNPLLLSRKVNSAANKSSEIHPFGRPVIEIHPQLGVPKYVVNRYGELMVARALRQFPNPEEAEAWLRLHDTAAHHPKVAEHGIAKYQNPRVAETWARLAEKGWYEPKDIENAIRLNEDAIKGGNYITAEIWLQKHAKRVPVAERDKKLIERFGENPHIRGPNYDARIWSMLPKFKKPVRRAVTDS